MAGLKRRWWLLCLAVLMLAFPASALAVDGIGAAPATLSFEQEIGDGATASQTSVVTNHGTTRTVTAVNVVGTDAGDFTVLTTGGTDDCSDNPQLDDGDSCELRVEFDPTTAGSKDASVDVVTDDAGPNGTATVALQGQATDRALSANPTLIDFSDQPIGAGATSAQTTTITNTGAGPVVLNAPTIGGTDGSDFQFDPQPGDCDAATELAETETCDIHVVFDPTLTGGKTAFITVSSNAPNVQVDLAGNATDPALSASDGTLSFTHDIDENATSPPEQSTITNTGTGTVTISDVTITGSEAADFQQVTDQGTDCTPTTVLIEGATCDVRVTFDPGTTGTKNATVTVESNEPDVTIDLQGEGTQTELTRSPDTLHLGDQEVDAGPTNGTEDLTITNSGSEDVTISSVEFSNTEFGQATGVAGDCDTVTPLGAGQDCVVRVRFDPSARGARSGTVTVHSNADDVSADLDGTGIDTELTPSPTSLSFADTDIDDPATAAQDVTVTNTGTEPVDFTSAAFSGTDPTQFTRLTGQGTDCTPSSHLNVGASCHLRIAFDPSTVGAKSADFTIQSNAPTVDVPLSGEGIQTELTPAPATLAFGSQELDAGPTAPQTSTVTNTGTEPVTITGVSIGGDHRGQFERLTDDPDDCSASTPQLGEDDSCNVRVRFNPSWEGAKSATVTVASNAPDVTIALTGTGTQTTFARSDSPLDSFLFDGTVNAVAFDSAGRTYVGGSFSSIGRRTGRGVKLTTTDDQPAPNFPDVDGPINVVATDGSGGWFIGGSFATVGGAPRANLAHILSNGTLDASWHPDPDNTVFALARSGSQLYVGGDFTHIGGVSVLRLASVSATSGTVDSSFTLNPNNTVTALTVSGTDLYVGGNFTEIGFGAHVRLARIDTGLVEVDGAWEPGSVNGQVHSIAVAGAAVYVAGTFTQIGTTTRNRIARVAQADGALDPTWNPNANGTVNALAIDGSGVYAGGAFTNIGTQPRNRIARLSASGAGNADSWNPDANGSVNAFALAGTDLYTLGAFTQIGGQSRNRIARVSTASALADSWNPNANGPANALAIAGSDIFVGGSFTSVGAPITRGRIARLLPDGTVDPDWAPITNNTVNALLVSGADVFVGGQFTSIGGQTRNRLAKLTTAMGGAADPTWDPDAGSTVFSLARSGTDLFVGGQFTTMSTQTHNRIAKVPTTGTGTANATWTPSASASVLALATDGTSVYLGGTFITVNSGPVGNRPFVAKVSATGAGALDPTWTPAADSTVRALVLSGSHVFAAGDFTTIGGQTRNHIAKLTTADGTADLSWDANANATARALTIAGNDLYAGGDFTLVGGVSHNNVVRLPTGDGGAHDSGWNPIANGTVNALATTNTRLAAGGAFTTVHSQSRQGVALFDLPRLWRDPSGQQFGSQDISDGATAIRTTVVTNAGAVPLTFSSLTLTGPNAGDFTRLTGGLNDCTSTTTLAPSEDCNIRVEFDPSTTGIKTAWVDIEAPNTPDATIGLAGTGTHVDFTRSRSTLSFGFQDIDDGPAPDQQSVVTNTGSQPITITGVPITPSGTDFTRLTGEPTDCFDTRVLNAGQTCNVRVQWDPETTGAHSATATVMTSVGDLPIALEGTGTQTLLTRSPATLPFGKQDIDDNATAPQTSTVTNSGTEPVTLTGINPTGDTADFTRLTGNPGDCTNTTTLNAGQTCDLRYAFDPGTVGAKSATVTVDSNAADITVSLTGEGTQTELSRSPTSLSFGPKDIDDGATAAQESTVTNSGTEQVTITGVDVSAHFAQVTGLGTDCGNGTVLNANATCKVRIEFNPTSVGAKTGSATVHSNAADVSVALDGTGIQTELSRSPGTLPFGKQDIDDNATAPQTSTVTNSGTEPVTLTGINPTGDTSDFTRLTSAGTDCTSTQTLNAGQTCDLRYTFDPGTVGNKSVTVTVDSNAADITVTLTGEGTQTELSRSPTSLAFGGQDVDSGATAAQTSVVTNSGTETVNLSSVTVGGTDPGQFVRLTDQGTDCTATTSLDAGETCDVRVRFDPSTQGAKTAQVSVASNAATITVDLSGTGKETKLSRTPTSLSFGSKDIDDGPTAEQFSTIENVGSEDVSLGAVGIVGTDADQFVRQTGQAGDCSTSTTLTAGQTCKVRVVFNPSTVGGKSATARVSANGVDQDVALDGTGIQTELSRSPATLSFGSKDIDDGATASQESTVTNSGSEQVTVTGVDLSGDFAQVTGDSTDCVNGKQLNAGQTCKVRVTFNPTVTGARTGSATVHSNAADVSVALDGTGTQTELSRAPATLSFGSKDIDDGATASQESTVTNSGSEQVTVTGVDVTGDFAQVTGDSTDCVNGKQLNAGQTCKVRITFNPGTVGSKTGSATVHSNAADVSVALDGTGIQTELSRSPATLSFGSKDIDDGATASQESMVTNSGSEQVTVTGVDVSGDFAQVTGDSTDCVNGKQLNAGQTCKVRITFNPGSTGAKSGSATVHSNAADVSVALDGTGTQTELSRSPATLSFGDRDIDEGATAAQESTVTNSGTQPVTVSGVNMTGEFAQVTGDSADCVNGKVLNATQTCKVRLTFDPTTTGAKTGSATVTSNAADVSVALDGTGIQTELTRSPATLSFGSKDVDDGTGIQTELTRSPATLSFGSKDVDDGATAEQPSTVTNSGTEAVTLSSVGVTGDFAQVTGNSDDCVAGKALAANDTCKVRVTFDPTATGSRTGTATISAPGGVSLSVDLDGSGIQTRLSSSVPSISAGSQDVDDGPTSIQQATLTNTGTEKVTLTGVSLAGADTGDFQRLTGDAADCSNGRELNAGQTCRVRVRFDPGSTGAKSAHVTVSSNAAPVTINLSGRGIQTLLTRDPSALDFGSHQVGSGSTAIQQSTVTNTGTESVKLDTIRLLDPGAARFLLVTATEADCVAGKTLAAGESCKLRAMYVPQSVGAKTGTVVFSSALGEATVVLTARGTPAPTLAIPSFSARAGSTNKKRLKVPVKPAGGTIRSIVVDVRSRAGKLLGTGKLSRASKRTTVTVKLKKKLAKGRYVAKARGRNAFGKRVNAKARNFRLR